eukprot:2344722-Pyramimonas_sp.AAC.1
MVLDGTMFGWPGRRSRFYAVLLRADLSPELTATMQSVMMPLFARECLTTFKHFFCAQEAFPEELKA